MRFVLKPKKLKPQYYETRTISKFAWFPIKINREIYWLEKVTVMQMYRGYWENLMFITDNKKQEIKNE